MSIKNAVEVARKRSVSPLGNFKGVGIREFVMPMTNAIIVIPK